MLKGTVHNRFEFEIFDNETEVTTYAKAENIVLNSMWSMLNGKGIINKIAVGDGSGEFAVTRTSLFHQIAEKDLSLVERIHDTATTGHVTYKATFSELEANGVWSEVGLKYGGTLVTHADIVNSEGDEITISKTDTKIITIYATVFGETYSSQETVKPGPKLLNVLLGEIGQPYDDWRFSPYSRIDGTCSKIGLFDSGARDFELSYPGKTIRVPVGKANKPIRVIQFGDGFYNSFGSMVSRGSSDNTWGYFTFPVENVFEGMDYEDVDIGTGDESETEFDLPVAYPRRHSEKIYVDGILQTRGIDYYMHYGVNSNDLDIVDTGSNSRNIGEPWVEAICLPQAEHVDDRSVISSITMVNSEISTYAKNGSSGCQVWLSMDGDVWVLVGEKLSGWGDYEQITFNVPTPAKYMFAKFKFLTEDRREGGFSRIIVTVQKPTTKHIQFVTPPTNGKPITADFTIDYINKTEDYVLDLQADVSYGPPED